MIKSSSYSSSTRSSRLARQTRTCRVVSSRDEPSGIWAILSLLVELLWGKAFHSNISFYSSKVSTILMFFFHFILIILLSFIILLAFYSCSTHIAGGALQIYLDWLIDWLIDWLCLTHVFSTVYNLHKLILVVVKVVLKTRKSCSCDYCVVHNFRAS